MVRRKPSEALRGYVRERANKRGKLYRRGNPTALARALSVDPGWVTRYTDESPEAHASLEQAIAICDHYELDLGALAARGEIVTRGTEPASSAPGGHVADAVTGLTIQALAEENTRLRGIIDRISDIAAELAVLATIDKKSPNPRRKVARGARGTRKDS